MSEAPQEIREKEFTIVRRGYDRSQVASFLASVAADLSATDPEEIREKTFSIARRGYDRAEVASYLARVAYQLESSGVEEVTGSSLGALFDADDARGVDLFAPGTTSSADDHDTDAHGTEAEVHEETRDAHGAEEPAAEKPAAEEPAAEEPAAMVDHDIGPADDTDSSAGPVRPLLDTPSTEGSAPDLPPWDASASLDDDGFERAATEIAALMHEAHDSTLRLRAEAEELERRRQAAEDRIAAARAESERYVGAMKAKADRYHAEAMARARSESEQLLEQAEAEAAAIVENARREADQIVQGARGYAHARSSEVLERSRLLVESLSSLEADGRRRLSEAQQAIDAVLDAATVTELPGIVDVEETPDADADAATS